MIPIKNNLKELVNATSKKLSGKQIQQENKVIQPNTEPNFRGRDSTLRTNTSEKVL